MSSNNVIAKIQDAIGLNLPLVAARLTEGDDSYRAVARGLHSLEQGGLSWAQLNQILHRMSEPGMSEGFFRYYGMEVPNTHPYPVNLVLDTIPYRPPSDTNYLRSGQQVRWGLQRFMYDAMLYWGNFRQAYRELRNRPFEDIRDLFARKRVDKEHLLQRGQVDEPASIAKDHRYLISEMACKSYEPASELQQTEHVKLALEAYRALRSQHDNVTPSKLKAATEKVAKDRGQLDLFNLMYEDAGQTIESEADVLALYSGQWKAFRAARETALENTRVYLSMCNDLDVYVATSMRSRQDFREMTDTCNSIFRSETLKRYNIRYFDPTLSAAKHHEDKGLIECLMVKMAKVLLYFSQHKESLGKVSEYAMALSLGKPVIVLCPDDPRGQEIYQFYRDGHPLMRLVEFKTGTANGAMVTHKVNDVITLLERIFTNRMEYDLQLKDRTIAYYLMKERLTGTTVRVITDDKLLTETFWNNWHGNE